MSHKKYEFNEPEPFMDWEPFSIIISFLWYGVEIYVSYARNVKLRI